MAFNKDKKITSTTLALESWPLYKNRVLQGSLGGLVFHLPHKAFFTNPLLTRDQEPQWVEYSGPKVGVLQRHLANCLKDKKDVW